MALEPSLWGTLPEELLRLVFARLPVTGIARLRVLSKEWKRNIDCKDSEFNRVIDATTHLQMFALLSWTEENETFVSLHDVQTKEWHVFEIDMECAPRFSAPAADGRLFCIPWQWWCAKGHLQIFVVNPLTRKKMELPPLLSMGGVESDVRVKMVQLTMDRKTKECKLHVVCFMKTGGNMKTSGNGYFAQVYDSQINGWSMLESREGRIMGWGYSRDPFDALCPCVYNCADGDLQLFDPSDIAAGLTVEPNCMKLINGHFFVLHRETPPGSTNLVQDGESVLGKYCISEFHLPEKATAWVKVGVHKCDPSIYDSREEDYELNLLACNGFLLVHSKEFEREYDRFWLYNLSTCAWRRLTGLGSLSPYDLVMCNVSWSALSEV